LIDLALDRQANPLLWHCVIGPLRELRLLQRRLGVREVRCSYFGTDFRVDLRNGYGFDVATRRFEHGDLARMVRALRRIQPTVFLDVGANIGLYTCIIGTLFPALRIVALEPDPTPFAVLETEMAQRGFESRATLIRSAAGASDGGEIGLVKGSGAQEGMTMVTQVADGYCSASLVTLDALDLPREGCIAIKIDVDGYELDVLRGGSELFRRNRGYVQIEAMGENIRPVADWMAAAGWRTVDRYGINSMFEKP
jgi:FkbM family methyltransferase